MASPLTRVRGLLPRGQTLPAADWQARHAWMQRLLWLNAVGLFVFSLARGFGALHAGLDAAPVVAFALVGHLSGHRRRASAAVSLGLLTASAVLVHVADGYIEAHFHFFVMIVVLALYEDWLPFGLAALYVLVHHVAGSLVEPSAVFNHAAGQHHPVAWSGVHAAFVAAAGSAAVIGWRLNEDSRDRLRSAFEDAVAGMAQTSPDGRIDRVNRAFARLLGRPAGELEGRTWEDLLHPADATAHAAEIARTLDGGQPGFTRELRFRHGDGQVVWAAVTSSLVSNAAGRPLHFVAQVQDVTDRRRATAALEHQAAHDALTGLPNRTLLLDRLRRALALGARPAVLFLDVDRFKLVNDSLGHAAGDALLVQIGKRLQAGAGQSDTVARFGGDEFVVVVEDVRDEAAASALAERLAAALAAPVQLAGEEHVLAASIGIAVAGDGAGAEALLRDADAAMYAAKARGGGIACFTEAMRSVATERLELERAMRRGLAEGQFVLHYQPIVALADGRPRATEALVRWRRDGELIPPGAFIPLAEETGFVIALGAWVLGEACRRAARWRAEAGDDAPLPVHVNVAARQLGDPELVDVVRRALADSGARPTDLAIEITESGLIDGTSRPAATLEALKALGIRIVLDDFGTGYSSLSHLQHFPIDEIKVDRSFVTRITEHDGDAAIVEAILGMARGLGIGVVAEGVERSEQADALAAFGCTLAQGFLFGRPAPEELGFVADVARAAPATGRATPPGPARTPAPRR
jgi:diguanylate cyclase (GGDEF)-like protein/PAS domain S-box-containing protein